jgi:ABC-2 type transport system permease protein
MTKSAKHNLRKANRKHSFFQLILMILIIAAINFIASEWFFRLDLTAEKRYSLHQNSKEVLSGIDDVLYVKVYLDGKNMPVGFNRLQRRVKELLDDFRVYSSNIEYDFVDPFDDPDFEVQRDVYYQLLGKGLIPTNVQMGGGSDYKEQVLFPGAVIRYRETDYPVNFFVDDINTQGQQSFDRTYSELESNFIRAIWMLTRHQKQKIAFIEGHNELDEHQTTDIMVALSEYYVVHRLKIAGVLNSLNDYSAVIVAKPQSRISEKDKFILDQYIMEGGSVLWLIEWMQVSMDSLTRKPYEMALINDINLDDQLFRYGVRINPDLVQDLKCLNIPVVVNMIGGEPQFKPMPWYFFPLIVPDTLQHHPINRNVSRIRTHFISSIDTVGDNINIKKTPLLRTSEYSKSLMAPVEVSLDILNQPPEFASFNRPHRTVAVLLEGVFDSNFDMRIPPEIAMNEDINFKAKSEPTKMIVISDGDIIRNEVRQLGDKMQTYVLGEDKYYPEQFCHGNKEFILNCVNYLCEDESLIQMRMREIKLRELNHTKVRAEGLKWVWINTIVPVGIILLIGIGLLFFRRYKFGRIKK